MEINEPHENPIPPFNPYEPTNPTRKILYWVVFIFSIIAMIISVWIFVGMIQINPSDYDTADEIEIAKKFKLRFMIPAGITLLTSLITVIWVFISIRKVGNEKEKPPIILAILNLLTLNLVCGPLLIIIACQTPKRKKVMQQSDFNQNSSM